ncbi:alpha-amylase family glycosyl hydrolase [Alteromonas sp. ASW11-130]|uniref:alpha-amylase family glycosyl hydrolase n=1 Tax=Alteromonas sp. ASW11-130 TaxID=3015775 RepID=UPI0022423BA4|nr:alpha-amylase family glycosyl hydrolase [Alteromonas sp. ASW11-130]MCW8092196.1 alpha-amylase family glycosyl hydrolase [Alteromonas sp. ASW11-130]
MLLQKYSLALFALANVGLLGCSTSQQTSEDAVTHIYGTKEPFTAEAIYFVMTDRFVDGDASNNYPQQGGQFPTWERKLNGPDGKYANVGYMGGDLKGILQNAQYIKNMGFTAIWLTPIIDNPNEAFSGGKPIEFGGMFKDGGKTGYHGYWGTNFYKADEHFVSADLTFADYTHQLKQNYGLKTVFDIVANHGSPSFTMPVDQPMFGELYDEKGGLVADHQNLLPSELNEDEPLHAFFHHTKDIAELSNLNEQNADLRNYLINSYLFWIEQGVDALRIDTIKHVPHSFWREMSERIRSEHPGLYMFGESFNYEANFIAQHTLPKNGGISVLDFPMQKAMVDVFEDAESDFAHLLDALHLTHGPYANPYDLTTFYDNHDMKRMNASDDGFINANNWLFTVRGIPVVYQGSEMGYMRGTQEHQGNRNYFGQDNIESAKKHIIHQKLSAIAHVRQQTPALQRGLQVNIKLKGDKAIFYRILQDDTISQTALVLLNKGSSTESFVVKHILKTGLWREALSGEEQTITDDKMFASRVAANSVQVWVNEDKIVAANILQQLTRQMNKQ